ncbi:helix-turn-helix transcriptional regulator [Paenibacillus wynnii]|uniref:Transcriptional regulator n=1 Tax=Paenibacillus wynnii TaxID=268407 RepID=A0A098M510_9BACL|nr:YafY family protein [Paenibacillus wynnii]KGE17136.1 transcriptional regulator [Paenibacillus wynnii]
MNKTDRLLAIILELQRKGMQRAEDLAGTFETSIRTIYRDVQALSEAGVPVIGAPGMGYSLMEGYFLPPVSFTADEAVTLLIGIDFVEQQFDADYRAKAMAGRSKIEAVLPENVRLESLRIREGMKIISKSRRINKTNAELLGSLREAIQGKRKVRMIYAKVKPDASEDPRMSREIDPYGLVFINGGWILVAFCHVRQGLRHFRVSRIQSLELLKETFILAEDFQLHSYKPIDDRNLLVRLLIRPELASRVKDNPYYYMEHMEDQEDGLLVTLRVREPEEVLDWVLGWGGGAVVLEPEILRQKVRLEAENMLKRY